MRASGRSIDIGLLAEALIYYENVAITITTQPEFAEWLQWFVDRGLFYDLLGLLGDGTIRIYDYAFSTLSANKNGVNSLWNFQDPVQLEPNSFERRFLYHPAVEGVLSKSRHRQRLYRALRDRVTEVKSIEFDRAIENARSDLQVPARVQILLQAYIDELHKFKGLAAPSEVVVEMSPPAADGTYRINTNIDFDRLSRLGGPGLEFHVGTPLNAAGFANKLLWSAAKEDCDLYLPAPVATIIGDKLFEGSRVAKVGITIDHLQKAVEFPDIRKLVGGGDIGWKDVMAIRAKAGRFRSWLQDESSRDRDALIAYHHEVAKESGLTTALRKSVHLFGIAGGAAAGAVWSGPAGAAAGAVGGYLLDLASQLGANWRPVVFGNWTKSRIARLLDK